MSDSRAASLVLVVDDYEDTREIVRELLEDGGFRVETAASGLEALEKAERLLPDAIVMDLSLPGMDGWEVTRRIKMGASTRAIRVIALTAHALEAHLQRARELGSDCVITKPCDADYLINEVRRVLAEPGSPPPRQERS